MSYANDWFDPEEPQKGAAMAAYIIAGLLLALLFGKATGLIN